MEKRRIRLDALRPGERGILREVLMRGEAAARMEELGLLPETDFERIYSRVKLERSLLEEKKQELELRKKSPVPTEDRAKELVQRFMDSAFASRELLVSLIDRIELTEEKQVIIKFRFAELDEVG